MSGLTMFRAPLSANSGAVTAISPRRSGLITRSTYSTLTPGRLNGGLSFLYKQLYFLAQIKPYVPLRLSPEGTE